MLVQLVTQLARLLGRATNSPSATPANALQRSATNASKADVDFVAGLTGAQIPLGTLYAITPRGEVRSAGKTIARLGTDGQFTDPAGRPLADGLNRALVKSLAEAKDASTGTALAGGYKLTANGSVYTVHNELLAVRGADGRYRESAGGDLLPEDGQRMVRNLVAGAVGFSVGGGSPPAGDTSGFIITTGGQPIDPTTQARLDAMNAQRDGWVNVTDAERAADPVGAAAYEYFRAHSAWQNDAQRTAGLQFQAEKDKGHGFSASNPFEYGWNGATQQWERGQATPNTGPFVTGPSNSP